MKNKAPKIALVILGLIYFVFGLNGLHPFLPMPKPEMSPEATVFMTGMMGAGYFMPVLKVTETVCGLLMLTGFYVPLVLVILAPITIQILLVHTFLIPSGAPLAIIMVALHVFLGWSYRAAYAPLLRAK
jgi:uncharacterized membrane protein YphA (DoxX/SURF4 family)